MIPFRNIELSMPTTEEMEKIYEKIKTPRKLGAVMKWDDYYTDCPSVFKKDGTFYMYFIAINKDCDTSGYETHLAKSDDLLNWEYIGPILRRNDKDHWDSKQCGGYAGFMDIAYGGTNEVQKVNGSYYISYLAGNSDGYEPDPLYMGLAKSDDPTALDGFMRFEEPILRPDDVDARVHETKTLYKSFLFKDPNQITGYPYVNAYNAKSKEGKERLFLAVSEDGERWQRYGDRPVIDLITDDPDGIITGDPQIVLVDDVYVMLFFRFRAGKPAYDTFACSRDLVRWRVWDGKPLIESEFDFEDIHSHKPWFLRHEGVNYHFYCAVNSKNERFIAVAVSEPDN